MSIFQFQSILLANTYDIHLITQIYLKYKNKTLKLKKNSHQINKTYEC